MARNPIESVQGSMPRQGLEAQGEHFYPITIVGKKLVSNQTYYRSSL